MVANSSFEMELLRLHAQRSEIERKIEQVAREHTGGAEVADDPGQLVASVMHNLLCSNEDCTWSSEQDEGDFWNRGPEHAYWRAVTGELGRHLKDKPIADTMALVMTLNKMADGSSQVAKQQAQQAAPAKAPSPMRAAATAVPAPNHHDGEGVDQVPEGPRVPEDTHQGGDW